MNNKVNSTENTIEQIKAKLKLMHNDIITPKDFIFSIDWLEKLVNCRYFHFIPSDLSTCLCQSLISFNKQIAVDVKDEVRTDNDNYRVESEIN
jgi:hypothetical protein